MSPCLCSSEWHSTDEHPLIGRSAPDFEFEDDTRLGAYLHDGTGLLVDFAESTQLQSLGQRWSKQVKYLSAKAKDSKGITAMLVRPDGFVAWATEAEPNLIAIESSMKLWFSTAT